MAYCDKCGNIVAEADIRSVRVLRQTFSSPAEYSEWCAECVGEDRDEAYERANLKYKETHGSEL
jgi:hypothetical protein